MANPTMTLIASNTVGSGGVASVTFSSIPATYTDLLIKCSGRTTYSGGVYDDCSMKFNSSATSYNPTQLYSNGSAYSNSGFITTSAYIGTFNTSTLTANTFNSNEIYIPNYASSNYKSYSVDNVEESNQTGVFQNLVGGLWSNTAAITSINIYSLNSSNFVQYSSFSLYGISNS